jgi:hypothetical protein
MARELLKIKCFNVKQLERAKQEHKNYSLTPINSNGFKFVILECWEETENLFSTSTNENTETTATEEQYY